MAKKASDLRFLFSTIPSNAVRDIGTPNQFTVQADFYSKSRRSIKGVNFVNQCMKC